MTIRYDPIEIEVLDEKPFDCFDEDKYTKIACYEHGTNNVFGAAYCNA